LWNVLTPFSVEHDTVTRPKTPRDDVLRFLKAVEAQLEPDQELELYLGGGAALILAYDGELATVDVDFIGPKTGRLLELSKLMGKGSEVHAQTELYFDVVPPGLFPSDMGWRRRAIPVELREVQRIRLRALEVHDLIISKLKRFAEKDRRDVRALCNRPDVDVETLRSRYREARLLLDLDERERMDLNFQVVEVEYLGREPSEFE
jgi:hypothetical protein